MTDHDWNARLGILVPSANSVFERDAQIILPPRISAHFARMKLTRDEPEQIAGLIDYAPAAAGLLADAGVDAVAFACTTGSLDGGLGYDRRIIDLIEEAAGVPATTTATALVEALATVGAGTVALVSPYERWLNDKVVAFLDANGVKVDGLHGFAVPDPDDIVAISPVEIVDAVRRVDSDRVDAVFISCTGFRGVEAVNLIGRQLGKPVLSSNQVTFWKLAQMIGEPSLFEFS